MTSRILSRSAALIALGLPLLNDAGPRRLPPELVAPLLARVPAASEVLSFSGQGFPSTLTPLGQSDTAPSSQQLPAKALDVRIPALTSAPFQVSARGRSARVPIKLRGARAVPLELESGRGVYRSVYDGVDVIAVRDPDFFELAFVVNEPSRAPVLALQLGDGQSRERLSIERESGAAVVRSAAGSPLLRIDPPVALDAAGTRREGRYELLGSELTIALNLSDLTPPVVIDPRFAIPFWTLLSDDRAPGSVSYGAASGSREIRIAFDEARGKPVLIRPVRSQQREDSATGYAKLAYEQPTNDQISSGPRVAPDGLTAGAAERLDWTRTFFAESETWEWSGAGWNLLPLTGITGLIDPALAFDRGRQRLVVTTGANSGLKCMDGQYLLGAAGRNYCTLTQPDATYELGPQGWQYLPIASPPPPRIRAALAPFPPYQVLFGGRALEPAPGFPVVDPYGPPYPENLARGLLNDTWRYDGQHWERVPTANPPTAREDAHLVLDERRHRLVLVGGGPDGFDLWEFDGTDWLERVPAGATTLPVSLRGRKKMLAAWNPVRQATLLFGGIATKLESCPLTDSELAVQRRDPQRLEALGQAGCLGGYVHDSWEWDGQALHQLTQAAYSGRLRGVPVFRQLPTGTNWFTPRTPDEPDAARSGPPPLLPWRFDPDPAHFRLRSALERAHAPAGTAPARNSVPATPAQPLAAAPAGPPSFASPLFGPQASADLVLDPLHSKALLVTPEDGRVLETDGAVWNDRTPGRTPFATGMQDFFAAAWDSAKQVIVLFDPRTATTWTHSDATGWTRLSPTVSPPVWSVDPEIRRERDLTPMSRSGADTEPFAQVARKLPQMTYDRARGRIVMLHAGALWEFDGATWQQFPAPDGWQTCEAATIMSYDALRSRVVAVGCKLPGTTMEWDGAWHGPLPGPYTELVMRGYDVNHGQLNTEQFLTLAWKGTLQWSWQHPNALFETPLLGGVSMFLFGRLLTWDGSTWREGPRLFEGSASDWGKDLINQIYSDMAPPFSEYSFTGRDFVPTAFFPPGVEDPINHRIVVFRDSVRAMRELRLDVPQPQWEQVNTGDSWIGSRVHPHPFELLSAEHVTLKSQTDPNSIVLLQWVTQTGYRVVNQPLVLPRDQYRVPELLINNLFWPFRVLPDPATGRIRVLTHRGAVWELGAELRTGPGDHCTSTADCFEGFCSPEGICCDSPCNSACSTCGGTHPGLCRVVEAGQPDPVGRCGTGSCAGVCSGNQYDSGCVYDPSRVCGSQQLGQTCTSTSDCAAGSCSPEGLCCDTACDGACVTCNGGRPGHCEAVPAGQPDPHGRCGVGECEGVCSGPSAQPGTLPSCDYEETRACGPDPSCSNGKLTPGGHCAADAATCDTSAAPAACAGNLPCLDATSCKQGCSTRSDCNGPFFECNETTHSCDPDAVSLVATARGVQPSEWQPEVRRNSAELAAELRRLGFQADAQGRILFSDFAVAGVTPVFDPNVSTPATGFQTCLSRITACRLATSTVDECVAAAPRCTTDTPWTDEAQFDCCPSECLLEYFQLRTTGSPGNAMVQLAKSLCYPGLRSYLEGLQ